MTQHLSEIVEARKKLQQKLHSIGVTPEHYNEVLELLEEFHSSDLDRARDDQFHDTAYEMLVKVNAASEKNIGKFSILLRNFAVYVTRQALGKRSDDEIEEIVDNLVMMTDITNAYDDGE